MLKKLSAETNALNWFDIPVTDLDRAKKFYEAILDIQMEVRKTDEEEMALFPRKADTVMGLSGILSGSLLKSNKLKPGQEGPMIYLNATPTLQTVIDKIEPAGGKILQPKTKIPAGYIAVFTDTEGNKVGIHAGA